MAISPNMAPKVRPLMSCWRKYSIPNELPSPRSRHSSRGAGYIFFADTLRMQSTGCNSERTEMPHALRILAYPIAYPMLQVPRQNIQGEDASTTNERDCVIFVQLRIVREHSTTAGPRCQVP